jgi:hypothetical protein
LESVKGFLSTFQKSPLSSELRKLFLEQEYSKVYLLNTLFLTSSGHWFVLFFKKHSSLLSLLFGDSSDQFWKCTCFPYWLYSSLAVWSQVRE